MKYQQSEEIKTLSKVQTCCKLCLFATWDENKQIGCKADRLEGHEDYLFEAYDQDKDFYVINRLCSSFRPEDWNDGVPDTQKMKEENSISCSVIIFGDEMTQQEAHDLKYFIDDLTYSGLSKKIEFIIGHDENFKHREEIVSFVRKLSQAGISYNIIEYLSDLPNYFKEKDVLRRSTKNYILKYNFKTMSTKQCIKSINLLNNLINEDNKRISVLETDTGTIISRMLLTYYVNDYDNMVRDLIYSSKHTEYYYKYE